MKIDGQGKVHIAYVDIFAALAGYATNATGSWVNETIMSSVTSKDVDLALGSDGQPRVAIISDFGGLIYAVRTDSGWTTASTVPEIPLCYIYGFDVDLWLAPDDTPHMLASFAYVTYAPPANGSYAIFYYTYSLDTWTGVPVTVGYEVSAAIDSLSKPRFAYMQYSIEGQYPFQWAEEQPMYQTGLLGTPEPFGSLEGRVNSLVLDPQDMPHMSYFENGLYYAHRTDSAWVIDPVDVHGDYSDAGTNASVALDHQGQKRFAYQAETALYFTIVP
jgi:hypothetical protein